MSAPEQGAMGNGVWKWLAALLAATLLAGLPGYINLYLHSPTRSEVDLLRDRQELVLQRLAAIDIRLMDVEETDTQLREWVEELRDLLHQIQN
jgi:hypothetical protein